MRLIKVTGGLLVAAGVLGLAACGGSSSSGSRPTADIRVVHAATDAPDVNVRVNGGAVSSLQNVPFGSGSEFLRVRADRYDVDVDALAAAGVLEGVISESVALERNTQTTVIAAGLLADESFGPQVIVNERASVPADSTRVQVVHAAPGAPEVSVFVTAPDGMLDMPLTTFSFYDNTEQVTVPAGEYRIRITAGSSNAEDDVVFDSGAVTLPGGADLLVLALDNTGPGAPVDLLVSTGAGNDFVLRDVNNGASLRAVHAASGVGTAEIFAGPAPLAGDATPVVEMIEFAQDLTLDGLTSDEYELRIGVAGQGVDAAPIVATALLEAGTAYTALAAGDLPADMGEPNLFALLAEDDRRSVATDARVRAIHAASLAGTVDVFVTPSAEAVTVNQIEMGEVMPTLPEFEVGDITPYLALPPGTYDVRVRAGGSVAIDVEAIEINGGSVTTLVARNADLEAGLEDFGFIVLAD
ncbi:MAG: DUF4397 domain-containing protein [Alcanivorax sp.]|nr:DUF4397 domain-containing protein [Alcanivorax sp.]